MLSDQTFYPNPIVLLQSSFFADDTPLGINLDRVFRLKNKVQNPAFFRVGVLSFSDTQRQLDVVRDLGVGLTGIWHFNPRCPEHIKAAKDLAFNSDIVCLPSFRNLLDVPLGKVFEQSEDVLLSCMEHFTVTGVPYSKRTFDLFAQTYGQ